VEYDTYYIFEVSVVSTFKFHVNLALKTELTHSYPTHYISCIIILATITKYRQNTLLSSGGTYHLHHTATHQFKFQSHDNPQSQ